jgi:hypothetical protein
MVLEEPPGVTQLAILHPHVHPCRLYRQGFAYALLVGKFILPRSFGENPILPSSAINNETSADRNLSFRYAKQNSREWQNARKRILHTMQPRRHRFVPLAGSIHFRGQTIPA